MKPGNTGQGRTDGGDSKTILLLGGYGSAGLPIAEILLEHTDVRLIVAGRDAGRAEEAARQLNGAASGDRVKGMKLDAADAAALGSAFRDCDLVAVCAPLTGIEVQVMAAALEARVDYVALNVEMTERAALEALSGRVEQAGLRFVIQGGLVPGVPAALVRGAAERFDRVRELTVGGLLRDRDISYGSAIDMVAATTVPSTVYQDGSWHRASMTATRSIDFGEPFGRCKCYPLNLPELESLPGLLGFERAGVYAAGINPLADGLAAVWLLFKLARIPSLARLGARLFMRAARRTRPPLGVVVMVELVGERAGREQQIRLLLQHTDGWVATAIPTVSCISQMLDGTVAPGLGMMGHVVDAKRLVQDMQRLGMGPAETVISS